MRSELQELFEALNPTWKAEAFGVAPDGDVFLTDVQVRDFQVPACHKCGGILKPDVTFFGDSVSREKVDFVYQRLAESDSMLVAGSSMQVSMFSSHTAFPFLSYSACSNPWSHNLGGINCLWIRTDSPEFPCILFLLWLESGFTVGQFGLLCHYCQSTSCCYKYLHSDLSLLPLPLVHCSFTTLNWPIKSSYLIQFRPAGITTPLFFA